MLWITDPWDTLDHPKDTTLRLIEEATHQGIQQYWCDVKSIRLEKSGIRLDAQPILSARHEKGSFERGPLKTHALNGFSSAHYRPDPPVDLSYLHPLQLIALGLQKAPSCEIVNPIEVLFCRNEKIEAAALKEFTPPSLISSQWDRLLDFGKKNSQTVLKPLHQAQSLGIERLDWRTQMSTLKIRKKLASATENFQRPVLLQAYLSGISEGETRLWFLDGKLLAHAKKMPLSGDFRVNIDRGSQLVAAPLTRLEKSRIRKISTHLKNFKIRLAAVDLIEGWITDFNFTSPGLIRQMECVLNENLAKPIIRALAKD